MPYRRVLTCLIAGVGLCSGSPAMGATVDFDGLPSGTRFGANFGHVPGEVVISQDDIDLSVEEFLLGSFVGFIKAEVGGRFDINNTKPLELDNISVLFDLTGLGFEANFVTLEYEWFGGANNFAVNGQTILELSPLTDLPTDIAPGVTAAVGNGSITLTGVVHSFLIGGQELIIDNITVVPEPATLVLLGIPAAVLLRRRRRQA